MLIRSCDICSRVIKQELDIEVILEKVKCALVPEEGKDICENCVDRILVRGIRKSALKVDEKVKDDKERSK